METSNKLTGQQLSLWTSSVGDIPVSPLALQDKEKEQTTIDTCGLGLEMQLAHYHLPTQSWRTYADISLWEEHKLLEILPTKNGFFDCPNSKSYATIELHGQVCNDLLEAVQQQKPRAASSEMAVGIFSNNNNMFRGIYGS
jgi:hypothetical protein